MQVLRVQAVRDPVYPRSLWLPFGRHFIPREFRAVLDWEGITLDIRVIDGRPTCTAITSRSGLTGSLLRRIQVDRLVKQATAMIAAEEDLTWSDEPIPEKTLSQYQAYVSNVKEHSGRKRLDDEFLRQVADVYREGKVRGVGPTQHVARALYGSRAAAGRWVREAREKDLLEPE